MTAPPDSPPDAAAAPAARPLLRVRTVYLEPEVPSFARGREILARFPDAERIEVPSHWNIPGLHGNAGLVRDWVRVKRDVLVLGVRKTMEIRPNGRSADFIAPAQANGCAMACAYCYVPRRKGFANPITTFVNIERIMDALARHAAKQGAKPEPNQVDPALWVYDVGENGDCSVDATISDNVRDLIAQFRWLAARYPVPRWSLHTREFCISLVDGDAATERDALLFGSLVAATRSRIGDFPQLSDLQTTLERAVVNLAGMTLLRSLDIVEDGCMDDALVVTPGLRIEETTASVGLGDSFTAGVLAML